jgi:hypothetical protein
MSNSPGPSHCEEKRKKKKKEREKEKEKKKESENIVRNIYISNKLWRATLSGSTRYNSFMGKLHKTPLNFHSF